MNEQPTRRFSDEAADLMNRFGNAVTDYYSGRIGEEKVMDMTTQPFWYSLRLTGRRLQKFGLTQTLRINDKRRQPEGGRRPMMSSSGLGAGGYARPMMTSSGEMRPIPEEPGERMMKRFLGFGTQLRTNSNRQDSSAVLSDNVTTERIYFRGNKKISNLVSDDVRYISAIKSNIENDKVCCPNCGFENDLASFIDGCDACGSKFDVHDFDTKVSGFALEGDIPSIIRRTINDSTKIYTVFFMMYIVMFFGVGILCAINEDISSKILGAGNGMIFFMILSLSFFTLFFGALFINVGTIIGNIIGASISKKYTERITGIYNISQKITDFSAEDFYQYLEQELRALHLTEKGEGLLPFWKAYSQVPDYSNVIDLDLTRVEFHAVHQLSDCYEISLTAYMRLAVYENGRVKYIYENADITLSGKKETVNRPLTALRLYHCRGCGSSIDIFGSEECPYCRRPIDYSDYGWTITEYSAKTVFALSIQTCRLIFAAAAVLIVGSFTLFKGIDIMTSMGFFR